MDNNKGEVETGEGGGEGWGERQKPVLEQQKMLKNAHLRKKYIVMIQFKQNDRFEVIGLQRSF